MTSILRDPVLDEAFRAQGFVIVDLFTPEEADELLGEFTSLQPADAFRPDGTGLNLSEYHCTFLDTSYDYRAASARLIEHYFAGPLRDLLPEHRLLLSNLYVKQPGTGRFEVHQNWQTTADLNDVTVTAWCPLVDTSPGNGTICVVPRSHTLVPAIEAVSTPKYYERFYDELIDHWLEPVPLRRGQCLLFDDTLLHWSDENASDHPRWAVQIDLVPDTADAVVYWLNHDAHPPRFEVFAADSSFYETADVTVLRQGPRHLPPRGLRPYDDLRIDEDQFRYLMDRGDDLRSRYFEGERFEDLFVEAMAAYPA